MGHWIRLIDPDTGETLKMDERFIDGGTYMVGGTYDCELSLTYNYGRIYAEVLPHDGNETNGAITWLYGKTGNDTLPTLLAAVAILGTERHADYWAATEGNAGAALARLASFAATHPGGIWEGD
jgi:hypothetical protein